MSDDQDGCEWVVNFLLVSAYPGSPRLKAIKQLGVCSSFIGYKKMYPIDEELAIKAVVSVIWMHHAFVMFMLWNSYYSDLTHSIGLFVVSWMH